MDFTDETMTFSLVAEQKIDYTYEIYNRDNHIYQKNNKYYRRVGIWQKQINKFKKEIIHRHLYTDEVEIGYELTEEQ
jgi:hypothetical protein